MDSSGTLTTLMRNTEELLERIADEHAPQIQRVRERLQDSLAKAKNALDEQRGSAQGEGKRNGNGSGRAAQRVGVRDLAGSLNDYVRRYPWLALATGVLLASSVGILATHATKRSYLHDS